MLVGTVLGFLLAGAFFVVRGFVGLFLAQIRVRRLPPSPTPVLALALVLSAVACSSVPERSTASADASVEVPALGAPDSPPEWGLRAKDDGAASVEWTVQVEADGDDMVQHLVSDRMGHFYALGIRGGTPTFWGREDAFLASYKLDGSQMWMVSIGSEGQDLAYDLTLDPAGDLMVSGHLGVPPENTTRQSGQGFLAKYTSQGQQVWMSRLPSMDGADAHAAGPKGDTFVGGLTSVGDVNSNQYWAVVVNRVSSNGETLWSRTYGNDSTFLRGLASDPEGNILLVGYTYGALGASSQGDGDVFLMKCSELGEPIWIRQLGTSQGDVGSRVAVDHRGDIVLAGYTFGQLGDQSFGEADVFVAKFSTDGVLKWLRQFGGSGNDMVSDLAIDDKDAITISGNELLPVSGSLHTSIFVSRLSSDGGMLWDRRFGGEGSTIGSGLALDEENGILMGGYWGDSADLRSVIFRHAFVARLLPPP